jgi:acyl-CoA thioester hydrolase
MSEPERYRIVIPVRSEDIDEQGHVNNVVYLRYAQEAATEHWRTRAAPEDQAALVWVVVRHEIDYKRPTFAGETLVAETWVGPASRRTFERRVEIRGQDDGRVRATVRSLWCPLDATTLRPTEPSAGVRERFTVPGTLER